MKKTVVDLLGSKNQEEELLRALHTYEKKTSDLNYIRENVKRYIDGNPGGERGFIARIEDKMN
ncbi:hypothetical protein IMZ31_21715 (plasmid) [Pontibacillus sp. ALD_SL1]|uniref:hypothetical protein n=1 Tax=Pontibacillus sp. ALD_SL1 TaxID=2777185 RepID=UPI001A97C11A|nr:hypothetical protein [Pontibacillus sp. ALD_SL1]QST02070.1 hypothetical protein IMZ31_21715 [Pontibacillus sp. ALD_SL1]